MGEVGTLLRDGTTRGQAETRGTCRKLLELEVALWTFVHEEGVEPTNPPETDQTAAPARRALATPQLRDAERRREPVRRARPGGTRTAVTTLREQHRDVLDYLTAACVAANSATTPPSLLPTGDALTPAA